MKISSVSSVFGSSKKDIFTRRRIVENRISNKVKKGASRSVQAHKFRPVYLDCAHKTKIQSNRDEKSGKIRILQITAEFLLTIEKVCRNERK